MGTTETPAAGRLQKLIEYHQADAGNINILRDIAREAMSMGQWRHALEALSKLRAVGALAAGDEAAEVAALAQMGRLDDACELARRAREQWPLEEAVQVEGARALLKARRFEEAYQWSHGEFSDPQLAQLAAEAEVLALWHVQKLEDAAQAVDSHLAKWPESARLLACKSAILLDQGESLKAFEVAHKAYAISPAQSYHALHVLAGEAIARRDAEQALRLVEQAQHVTQNDGRIWAIKGSANMLQGHMDVAAQCMQNALRLMPTHPGSYLTLAWIYLLQKRYDDAETQIRKAIDVSPSFAESHGSLAVVQFLKGQTDEARQSARRAHLLNRNSFAARYAQMLIDGAPAQEAQKILQAVIANIR